MTYRLSSNGVFVMLLLFFKSCAKSSCDYTSVVVTKFKAVVVSVLGFKTSFVGSMSEVSETAFIVLVSLLLFELLHQV